MFTTATIIFREILEMAIIISVIIASTKNIKNINKYIFAGFAIGLLGSGIIAASGNYISSLVSGYGDEIFNAAILIIAIAMISWTIIWMKTHAKELSQNIQNTGSSIASGDLPLISITTIIAIAIFREGSEIVIFMFGLVKSANLDLLSILNGAALGVFGGAIVSFAIFNGIIRLSPKYFFQFTSLILALLAAGMASQLVLHLEAIGIINDFATPVWDSSWLIGNDSTAGQFLKTLIGYTAKPSTYQVIFYFITLGGILTLNSMFNSSQQR